MSNINNSVEQELFGKQWKRNFIDRKQVVLSKVGDSKADKSPKGSIDQPILDLIELINKSGSFYTLSSCSGRISLYCPDDKQQKSLSRIEEAQQQAVYIQEQKSIKGNQINLDKDEHINYNNNLAFDDILEHNQQQSNSAEETQHKLKKNIQRGQTPKGGKWLYVTHNLAVLEDIINALEKNQNIENLDFLFEPFILALECSTLRKANEFLSFCREAGFRESGLIIQKRILIAVRSNLRVEVPLYYNGCKLTNDQQLDTLVNIANEKMKINFERIQKFYNILVQSQILLQDTDIASENNASPITGSRCIYLQNELNEHQQKVKDTQIQVIQKITKIEKKFKKQLHGKDRQDEQAYKERIQISQKSQNSSLNNKVYNDILNEHINSNSDTRLENQPKPYAQNNNRDNFFQSILLSQQSSLTGTYLQKQDNQFQLQDNNYHRDTKQGDQEYINLLLKRWGHSAVLIDRQPNLVEAQNSKCKVSQEENTLQEHAQNLQNQQITNQISQNVLVFGGYGGPNQQQRLNDLVLIDSNQGKISQILPVSKELPRPRQGQSFTYLPKFNQIILIGGRGQPENYLGDLWSYSVTKNSWKQLMGKSEYLGLSRHSASVIQWWCDKTIEPDLVYSYNIYIFGGLTEFGATNNIVRVKIYQNHLLSDINDITVFNPQTSTQQHGKQQISWPEARYSHGSCCISNRFVFIYGGRSSYEMVMNDLWCYDVVTQRWAEVTQSGSIPWGRFSHTLNTLSDDQLVLLGGCTVNNENLQNDDLQNQGNFDTSSAASRTQQSGQQSKEVDNIDSKNVYIFHMKSRSWQEIKITFPKDLVPIRHQTLIAETSSGQFLAFLIGGGLFCFSFGTLFSQSYSLNLTDCLQSLNSANNSLQKDLGQNQVSGIYKNKMQQSGIKPQVNNIGVSKQLQQEKSNQQNVQKVEFTDSQSIVSQAGTDNFQQKHELVNKDIIQNQSIQTQVSRDLEAKNNLDQNFQTLKGESQELSTAESSQDFIHLSEDQNQSGDTNFMGNISTQNFLDKSNSTIQRQAQEDEITQCDLDTQENGIDYNNQDFGIADSGMQTSCEWENQEYDDGSLPNENGVPPKIDSIQQQERASSKKHHKTKKNANQKSYIEDGELYDEQYFQYNEEQLFQVQLFLDFQNLELNQLLEYVNYNQRLSQVDDLPSFNGSDSQGNGQKTSKSCRRNSRSFTSSSLYTIQEDGESLIYICVPKQQAKEVKDFIKDNEFLMPKSKTKVLDSSKIAFQANQKFAEIILYLKYNVHIPNSYHIKLTRPEGRKYLIIKSEKFVYQLYQLLQISNNQAQIRFSNYQELTDYDVKCHICHQNTQSQCKHIAQENDFGQSDNPQQESKALQRNDSLNEGTNNRTYRSMSPYKQLKQLIKMGVIQNIKQNNIWHHNQDQVQNQSQNESQRQANCRWTKQDVHDKFKEIPRKWEKLGNCVLIPQNSMASTDFWQSITEGKIWDYFCQVLDVDTIAQQQNISGAQIRNSRQAYLKGYDKNMLLDLRILTNQQQLCICFYAFYALLNYHGLWVTSQNHVNRCVRAYLLYGSNPIVNHKENGIIYRFDITQCMFSSGNVTEKARMAQLDCSNEIVVDFFAGIGYYTLPLLKLAKAKQIYSCELNPVALQFLEANLALNQEKERCTILAGDCNQVAPKQVADRILLGLLPSSEHAWKSAMEALNQQKGGIIHIHKNVNHDQVEETRKYILEKFASFIRECKFATDIKFLNIVHIERVKSYAPKVYHYVFDLECRPYLINQDPYQNFEIWKQPAYENKLLYDSNLNNLQGNNQQITNTTSDSYNQNSMQIPIQSQSIHQSLNSLNKQEVQDKQLEQSQGLSKQYFRKGAGDSQNQLQCTLNSIQCTQCRTRNYQQKDTCLSTHCRYCHKNIYSIYDLQTQPIETITYSQNLNQQTLKNREKPLVIKDCDLGKCTTQWDQQYLVDHPQNSELEVSVHVTDAQDGQMTYNNKNFKFQIMKLKDLFQHCLSNEQQGQTYYLRSLGRNFRKQRSDFYKDYEHLAQDVQIPQLFNNEKYHSSVFRVSSANLKLWPHYDVTDNILMQIKGRKIVYLWDVNDADKLYLKGSSTTINDMTQIDAAKYPLLQKSRPYKVNLEQGDILFIPSLYVHYVECIDPSVAVNVFYKNLEDSAYAGGDLYANKDLQQAISAEQKIKDAFKLLDTLGSHQREFYRKKILQQFMLPTEDQ